MNLSTEYFLLLMSKLKKKDYENYKKIVNKILKDKKIEDWLPIFYFILLIVSKYPLYFFSLNHQVFHINKQVHVALDHLYLTHQ